MHVAGFRVDEELFASLLVSFHSVSFRSILTLVLDFVRHLPFFFLPPLMIERRSGGNPSVLRRAHSRTPCFLRLSIEDGTRESQTRVVKRLLAFLIPTLSIVRSSAFPNCPLPTHPALLTYLCYTHDIRGKRCNFSIKSFTRNHGKASFHR